MVRCNMKSYRVPLQEHTETHVPHTSSVALLLLPLLLLHSSCQPPLNPEATAVVPLQSKTSITKLEPPRHQAPSHHIGAQPAPEAETQPPEQTTTPSKKPATKRKKKQAPKWRPATLEVVTNFTKAQVTVNGLPYPSYTKTGEAPGVVLPAGGPYVVQVKAGERVKTYTIYLRPYETRVIIVELSGYKGSPEIPKPPAPPNPNPAAPAPTPGEPTPPPDKKLGTVTVFAHPDALIILDDKDTGRKSPATLEVEDGRHEVAVVYLKSEQKSEPKVIRSTEGGRIKLYFYESQ